MKKKLLTLGLIMAASCSAFAQVASDRLDIYGKDGKFVSVMKGDVQEITVGKSAAGEGYSSVSVTTAAGTKSRDIDDITEVKYSPIVPYFAHQLDTIHADNSEVVLLDWRNNTDVYDVAQIDPTKPADWRGAWADGIVHFILRTDKGYAAEFKITGEYSGKVYSDNPSFTFWSLKEISGLYCDSYAFYMPFEPVLIEATSWELDTYVDAPILGTYSAYGLIPAENRIAVNAKAAATLDFNANTTYTLKSTDEHEFDILDLYSWDEEKNAMAYVSYEGDLRNEGDVDVKHGLIGKFDGDFFFGTVIDILNNKVENSVSYIASRKDVEVTVAVADQNNQHILVEAKPAEGSDTKYFYYDINAIFPFELTAELSSGNSIGEACQGFLLKDGEKYLKYSYSGAGTQPEFTFRGSEAGTYTGQSGNLKLDGFGSCTLGDTEGTYKSEGGAITVTLSDEERYFAIDKSAKTYEETVSDPWDGREEYTLETARGAFRGGELNNYNTMSVKFTQNNQGKDVADIRFNIKRTDGFSGKDGISDLCSYFYDAENKTVVLTNVYMGTSATSTGVGTITLKVSDDKSSIWVDDSTSDRIYATGNVNSYLLTGTVNTMSAPKLIANGSGTEEDPYQLTTAKEVAAMKDVVALNRTTYFKLMNDIDMTGIDYIPAVGWNSGDYTKNVEFDGNHHIISNLTSKTDGDDFYYASLIGVLRGTVKDLGLVNVDLKSGLGASGIAVYVGHGDVAGNIINCYVTGTIESSGYAAGLVGTTSATATVTDSYAQVNVKSSSYAGGLVGRGRNTVTFNNCYVSGTVAGTADGAVVSLLGNTDNPATASLTLNNVVLLNTGAETQTNYTSIDGTPSTDVKDIKKWDAFNEGLLFNDLPALNWQENAVEGPAEPEPVKPDPTDPEPLTESKAVSDLFTESVSELETVHFNDDIDLVFVQGTASSAPSATTSYINILGGNQIKFVGRSAGVKITKIDITCTKNSYTFTAASDPENTLTTTKPNIVWTNDEGANAVTITNTGFGGGRISSIEITYIADENGSTVDPEPEPEPLPDLKTIATPTPDENGVYTLSFPFADLGLVSGHDLVALSPIQLDDNLNLTLTQGNGKVAPGYVDATKLISLVAFNSIEIVGRSEEVVIKEVVYQSLNKDNTLYSGGATCVPGGKFEVDRENFTQTWTDEYGDKPNSMKLNLGTGSTAGFTNVTIKYTLTSDEIGGEPSTGEDIKLAAKYTGAPMMEAFGNQSATEATLTFDTAAGTATLFIMGMNTTLLNETVGYEVAGNTVTLKSVNTFDPSQAFTPVAKVVDITFTADENGNLTGTGKIGTSASGMVLVVDLTSAPLVPEASEEPATPELATKYTGAPNMEAFGSAQSTETTLTFDTEAGKATLFIKGMGSTLMNETVDYEISGTTVTLKSVNAYDPSQTLAPVSKVVDITFTIGEDGSLTGTGKIGTSASGMVLVVDLASAPLSPVVE